MLKNYLMHVYCAVIVNKEVKVGSISAATGVTSVKVYESFNMNTFFEGVTRVTILVSCLVTLLALIRGVYTFRKELKKDRLERLKMDQKINKIERKLGYTDEVLEE